jgi:hypothetical protein
MMSKSIVAAVCVCIASASSVNANQFAGKSAEEVVSYIIYGYAEGDERNDGEETFRIEKYSTSPNTLRGRVYYKQGSALASSDVFDATTTKESDCIYTFETKPLVSVASVARRKLSFDFTNLKSVVISPGGQTTVFDGAKILCPAGSIGCNASEMNSRKYWPIRAGSMFHLKTLDSEQGKLNEAVLYFRSNICPAK